MRPPETLAVCQELYDRAYEAMLAEGAARQTQGWVIPPLPIKLVVLHESWLAIGMTQIAWWRAWLRCCNNAGPEWHIQILAEQLAGLLQEERERTCVGKQLCASCGDTLGTPLAN